MAVEKTSGPCGRFSIHEPELLKPGLMNCYESGISGYPSRSQDA